mgnify:CR=1 FL=1
MAQFQVYRVPGGRLVLDLQTDLIGTPGPERTDEAMAARSIRPGGERCSRITTCDSGFVLLCAGPLEWIGGALLL